MEVIFKFCDFYSELGYILFVMGWYEEVVVVYKVGFDLGVWEIMYYDFGYWFNWLVWYEEVVEYFSLYIEKFGGEVGYVVCVYLCLKLGEDVKV